MTGNFVVFPKHKQKLGKNQKNYIAMNECFFRNFTLFCYSIVRFSMCCKYMSFYFINSNIPNVFVMFCAYVTNKKNKTTLPTFNMDTKNHYQISFSWIRMNRRTTTTIFFMPVFHSFYGFLSTLVCSQFAENIFVHRKINKTKKDRCSFGC